MPEMDHIRIMITKILTDGLDVLIEDRGSSNREASELIYLDSRTNAIAINEDPLEVKLNGSIS